MSSLSLVPQPASVSVLPGTFYLTGETKIYIHPSFAGEAQYLAEILRRATNFSFPIEKGTAATDQDILLKETAELGSEGYRLTSAEGSAVSIESSTPHGIAHGIQTLLQLLPPAIYGTGPRTELEWTMPRVEIEDRPRFAWRGAMLDCSRHFKPVEFIKKFIDTLALHKLNILHWHLTDDQGWRLEIKRYPKLTEIGSHRAETLRGHLQLDAGGDGIPHQGYYTQEEAREIVAYAAERHITVVPEIEMPGHCQAALAAYPELGCTGETLPVWTTWGINPHIYNVKESTLSFLQDVLLEVMDIFPSRYIHVGGDEAVKVEWESNAEVQARMREVGAKDTHAMQSWFIRQMDTFLTKHGRRLVGWDEILEGGLAAGAVVMSWRGMEGGIAGAQAGHDVVMAPSTHTYFDHYQASDRCFEPLAIGGCITLEKTYGFDPIPPELTPEEANHILGIQGQLWSEYMSTPTHTEYMAFPRLCALAEVGWSPIGQRDFAGFQSRLERHLKRLDILEVRYRPVNNLL